MIEMSIDSISQQSTVLSGLATADEYIVILVLREKEGQRHLPIWLGQAEGDQIAVVVQNVEVPRPLTHDLVLSMINSLSGKVKMAAITALRYDVLSLYGSINDTFFSELVINKASKDIRIDCRPSDAIGIAARANAPIFADEKVLDSTGIVMGDMGEKKIEALEMASQPVQEIISMSSDLAKSDGKDYVETKHLLLALSKQVDCIASKVLNIMGANVAKILLSIDYNITETNDAGFSVNVREAIKLALHVCKSLSEPLIGTDHLLVGLTLERDGIAGKTLAKLGINIEGVLAELKSIGRLSK